MFQKSNTTVIELHPNNFIKHNGKIFVKHDKILPQYKRSGMIAIVASWCGYCQKMKTPYNTTSAQLGDSFPMFYLDAVKYKKFVDEYKLAQGFPTIKYLKPCTGEIKDTYEGERSVPGFIQNICDYSKVCKK